VSKEVILPSEMIENKIFLIRGKKVMLDRDLASLYKTTTTRVNEQVRRNIKRFPSDFMFQLTRKELTDWISQIAISNKERMGIRKRPLAFTEQGVAMLSTVLNSEVAIQVNIQIMRAFTKLREMISTHKELRVKIEELERKYRTHDEKFDIVFEAIKRLLETPEKSKRRIGFHSH